MPKLDALPPALAPRGLSRDAAAAYLGISGTTFGSMVERGEMPEPRRIGARVLWCRYEIDAAFSALPREGDKPAADTWAGVA